VLPYVEAPEPGQPLLLTAAIDNGITVLLSDVVHE
jgi:hypothetical protein